MINLNVIQQKWVVLNDIQLPFEDKPVLWDLVVPFVRELKPYGIVLNGDIVDNHEISDFSKDPQAPQDQWVSRHHFAPSQCLEAAPAEGGASGDRNEQVGEAAPDAARRCRLIVVTSAPSASRQATNISPRPAAMTLTHCALV
jgi:hypothetical protein